MNTYNQLTYEQRCQIYALMKTGNSQSKIRSAIGVSQSTISRELQRNIGLKGYRYKQAQNLTKNRRLSTVQAYKMTPRLIQSYTENGAQNKYQARYEKAKRSQSATKVFISIFGKTRNQVVSYAIIYVDRVNIISRVVRVRW
jgi:IS30 family transposase